MIYKSVSIVQYQSLSSGCQIEVHLFPVVGKHSVAGREMVLPTPASLELLGRLRCRGQVKKNGMQAAELGVRCCKALH